MLFMIVVARAQWWPEPRHDQPELIRKAILRKSTTFSLRVVNGIHIAELSQYFSIGVQIRN